ncbi:hypothetical protein [Maridesulfovibrio bastinii]|jgi:uncharacterized protein YlxW (UPF0749 family)|uniref:hypothetical protein n=1 Tax=Maridesulfovibrio bastinii TaxID=47157 RepID=UPI000425E155|nr:hypothetical protein [Maridesulfovibrio bastinii]
MFYFIMVGVSFIVLALILNRIVTNWYIEKSKFYSREEVLLTKKLNEAMQKHKMTQRKLRRLKSKIRSYEALLPNKPVTEKSDD